MIDYCIVEGATPTELCTEVYKKLKEGWKPIGGIAICVANIYINYDREHMPIPWFYQAMVKES